MTATRLAARLAAVLGCLLLASVTIVTAMPARLIAGTPVIFGPKQDPRFENVNAVSGTPAEWLSSVCEPQLRRISIGGSRFQGLGHLYLFATQGLTLRDSTFSAQCRSRNRESSDPFLLVARYRSEPPMQRDLARNGFQWYCFGADRGQLLVIATRAEEGVQSNGWSVSPILEPLQRYGFMVYSQPGQ